jgi:hypothetical protein
VEQRRNAGEKITLGGGRTEATRGGRESIRLSLKMGAGPKDGDRPLFRKGGSTKTGVGAAGIPEAVTGGHHRSNPAGNFQRALFQLPQGVTVELERLGALLHRISFARALSRSAVLGVFP